MAIEEAVSYCKVLIKLMIDIKNSYLLCSDKSMFFMHIIIGLFSLFKSLILLSVDCRKENLDLLSIDRYCLGKLFLDSGQSLEPLPPDKIIGNNLVCSSKFISSIVLTISQNIKFSLAKLKKFIK